jgi:hypothetical protein
MMKVLITYNDDILCQYNRSHINRLIYEYFVIIIFIFFEEKTIRINMNILLNNL